MNPNELLSSYDYTLPAELIAQSPVIPRDSSRLLVVQMPTLHSHQRFYDLPQYLEPNDLLVLNNTRVIPARLYGQKSTGTSVEILLLEEKSPDRWLALVKPGKKLKVGSEISFHPCQTSDPNLTLSATVLERDSETGGRILQFFPPSGLSFWDVLEQFGQIPFPPYVTQSEAQPDQYQTIYAQEPGAVAAPTAGLHFTDELLQTLANKGIQTAQITLHVGVGTFRPVETENIREHTMHQEWIEVPQITVDKIRETKAKGGRIIAIGTTSVRALEGAAQANFPEVLTAYRGKTNIFIYPGYQWQIVDGLITNFHLPKSSLLMLVSALIGREKLLSLYQEAIQENYRFYSFGDAMLILPVAK